MSNKQEHGNGCSGKCDCRGGMDRRNFLKLTGAGCVALLGSQMPAMAGPFDPSDFEKLIPADKKLSPEWIKSLYARGARTIYGGPGRMAELEKIGMPVGGICTGQLYLGGDGKLWHWDIFNKHTPTGDGSYVRPPKAVSPLDQGFAIRIKSGGKSVVKALDRTGFANITFCGEYPIGYVKYRDEALPVDVDLEAFSPFAPLNTDDSSLPATVMRFTVKNTGNETIEADIAGWLENGVCLHSKPACTLVNKIQRNGAVTSLECSAAPSQHSATPDIVFEDFEKGNYDNWTVTGEAFGQVPATLETAHRNAAGNGQPQGKFFVHTLRKDTRDNTVGTLTSKPFKIERDYIVFMICGPNEKSKLCVDLLIDGKVVESVTGKGDRYDQGSEWHVDLIDVRAMLGKTAQLRIMDNAAGSGNGRGYIGVDNIVFTNTPKKSWGPFTEQTDFGTMALAVLEGGSGDLASASLPDGQLPDVLFNEKGLAEGPETSRQMGGKKLCGAVGRKLSLKPGEQQTVSFVVAWSFPNLIVDRGFGGEIKMDDKGRHYANRFPTASAAINYLAANFKKLTEQTQLWHDTWYDATVPYWFLDRTFSSVSTLATSTCYRFSSGRFWGWEGVDCCPGTCTHVWHYAQAVGRVFPELERDARERVDFGLALDERTGVILYRGGRGGALSGLSSKCTAVDGQAGSILRAYREHQMAPDSAFLKRIWPNVKLGLEWLIGQDANGDGLLEGAQHNTLDCDFYGASPWLSGMYVAALRAGEAMAREVGDEEFARKAREIADSGSKRIAGELYDGEYFVQKLDPNNLRATNTTNGCHIDQVLGQSWMHQVNLGRMLPEDKTVSALKSLWKYNFAFDVGPYMKKHSGGRKFALPGEAGLIMCTWPKGAEGHVNRSPVDLFSECMNGFEYQAAGHMIFEGLVQEGLAVTRAIHDRYHASRRNPWNEIECGEHYARSMASYGVFLAACGFEYHGPKGHIGFSPRLTPENFKAPFTAAEGWGTFQQKDESGSLKAEITVKYGKLRVKTIALALVNGTKPGSAKVSVKGRSVASKLALKDGKAVITLEADAVIHEGGSLVAIIG